MDVLEIWYFRDDVAIHSSGALKTAGLGRALNMMSDFTLWETN